MRRQLRDKSVCRAGDWAVVLLEVRPSSWARPPRRRQGYEHAFASPGFDHYLPLYFAAVQADSSGTIL